MQKVSHEFLSIPTPCVSDAMLGLNSFEPDIKPLKECYRICGRAFTVNTPTGDNSAVLMALQEVKNGDILVIAAKGDLYRAIAGDFIVNMAQMLGVGGIVTDGAVRDHVAIRNLGLPVFCKGTTIAASFKNGSGEIDIPISCGGVQVNPGDLIIGDSHGVVVIPQNNEEEILKKAQQKLESDRARAKAVLSNTDAIRNYLKTAVSKQL